MIDAGLDLKFDCPNGVRIDSLDPELLQLMEAGKTRFIRIASLAGEPCRLKADLFAPLQKVGTEEIPIKPLGDTEWEIGLRKGEEVILYDGNESPDLTMTPLTSKVGQLNYYGLH